MGNRVFIRQAKTGPFSTGLFLLVLLAIIFGGILFFFAWSIRSSEEMILGQIVKGLRLSVRAQAQNVGELFSDLTAELDAMSGNPLVTAFMKADVPCASVSDAAAPCLFKSFFSNFGKNIDTLMFFDAQGRLLDRWPEPSAAHSEPLGPSRPDVASVLESRKPLWGKIAEDSAGDKVLSFARPLFEKDQFLGVAVAEISLQRFNELVQRGKRFPHTNFQMIDENAVLLSSPDPGQLGQQVLVFRRKNFSSYDCRDMDRFIVKMMRGEEGADTYFAVRWTEAREPIRVKKLTVFTPLEVAGRRWSLGIVADYDDLTGPIKEYTRNIFIGSGLIVILFLAGGVSFYRTRLANFDLAVEAKAACEWQQTFDAITDFVSIHESDYKILRVNKALADAFHKSPMDFVGKTCFWLFHGTNEPISECPHQKTIDTGKPTREEFFNPHLNRWLEVSISPIFNAKGKVVRMVHIAKDITARKKAQEKIQRLTKLLDDVIQNAPIGMYVVDVQGRVEYINKAMLEISGATLEQMKKLNLLTYEPYVTLGIAEKIRRALEGEPFRVDNLVFQSAFSGRVGTRHMAGIPMPGDASKVLIIVEDVTLKKEVEKVQRLAELGKFVGDAAHFIDNPLMVISGTAQMLTMESVTMSEAQESLKTIIRECDRAKNIIKGLYQFAEPEKQEKEIADIRGVLEDILVISRQQWKQAGIAFVTEWGLSEPLVYINSGQIKRAFVHLLVNAKEAMPDGGVIEVRMFLEKDGRLGITIKDSGKGMSEDVLDHVFDPFYSTQEGKSGLGVSVAYGIIREHGGDLKYFSQLGAGTTASVSLPLPKPR